RRGTAVVHQAHTGDVRVLPNPTRQDLRVTAVTLDPPSAQPVTLTAYAHPLPGSIVLGLVVAALVAAVVAFDRLGPAPEGDVALVPGHRGRRGLPPDLSQLAPHHVRLQYGELSRHECRPVGLRRAHVPALPAGHLLGTRRPHLPGANLPHQLHSALLRPGRL